MDAGSEYYQAENWARNRDWDQGRIFARFAARPDGSFQLELGKEDNSLVGYRYKKGPQAGDTWDEQWDEGNITLTYIGLENPGFNPDHEGGGRGEYKGYYTFYYHKARDGHHERYVYYPTTGREGVQYSKWLD
ncbi:MAG: hypothetical protein LBT87_09065 [Treponema sp.]|nr:hypothetical protein [Treponema sp.]